MILRLLLTNRLVRAIGLVLAGVLSFLSFGALNVRKGRLKERAENKAKSADAVVATETKRKEINAELDATDDLAAAARDAGLVRRRKP